MSVTSVAALKSPDSAVLKMKYFPDSPLSKAVRKILVESQGSYRLVITFITG